MTIEQCLKEYNKAIKQRIDDTFDSNVQSIKRYFDEEIRCKAEHPVTFHELAEKIH